MTAVLTEPSTSPRSLRVPSPVDVLDVIHAALSADPRRTRVSVVRDVWGMSHGAAVRALRGAFAACPDHPATRDAGLVLRTSRVIRGWSLTQGDIDGGAVDTAIDRDHHGRGEDR